MKPINQTHLLNNKDDLKHFADFVINLNVDNGVIIDIKNVTSKRTVTQNASLHKLCDLVSIKLNEAGYTFWHVMDRRIKKVMDRYASSQQEETIAILNDLEQATFRKKVSWSTLLVKDFIWRPIQIATLGKDSSTKLETDECSKVYEEFNIAMAGFGIHVPWPNKENMRDEQLAQEQRP